MKKVILIFTIIVVLVGIFLLIKDFLGKEKEKKDEREEEEMYSFSINKFYHNDLSSDEKDRYYYYCNKNKILIEKTGKYAEEKVKNEIKITKEDFANIEKEIFKLRDKYDFQKLSNKKEEEIFETDVHKGFSINITYSDFKKVDISVEPDNINEIKKDIESIFEKYM